LKKKMLGNFKNFVFSCTSSIVGQRPLTEDDIRVFVNNDVKYLELTIRDGFSSLTDTTECSLLKKAVENGLIIIHSAHMYHDFDEDISSASCNLEKIAETMRILANFNTKYLVLHPGAELEAGEERKRYLLNCVKNTERLYPAILDSKVKLALEIMPPGKPMSNYNEIDFILERTDPERVGLCVDVNHVLGGIDVAELIEKYGERILGYHFSDNDGIEEKHWPPFSGRIDWSEVMNSIVKTGYRGPLNFEYGYEDNLAQALQKRKKLFHRLISDI